MSIAKNSLRAAVVALAFAIGAPAAAPSPAFGAMLARAEQIRSADPAAFRALLAQMDEVVDGASTPQRELHAYLKVYAKAYDGRLDEALVEARELFETATDVDVRVRAGALMVHAYAIVRDYGAGLRLLDETLALEPKVREREVRHHAWAAAGVIHSQIGEYDRAREFAERMLADEPAPRTRCFADALRVEALYHQQALADQQDYATQVVAACEAIGEPVAAGFSRLFLARYRFDAGDAGRALRLLSDVLPAIRATRYPRLVSETLSLLAEIHLATGNRDIAERLAAEAVGMAGGLEHSQPMVAAERVLFESARQRGDTESALVHLQRHAAADKAYLDAVKARELAVQMVRQETRQKNQQIDLLAQRNRVLELERQVSRQTARNTQLVIALLATLLAFIGYLAWKARRMQLSFRRLAETDALTGISNRHHFTRRAEEALSYCRRAGKDAALVMFDLDEFKSINDRFGHATGDRVLEQVAAACEPACRKGDLFGRLGGEEFAFLLVGADAATGRELAEDCRRRLRQVDPGTTGDPLRITASFGIAEAIAGSDDLQTLLARADAAMYRAKDAGRDRVEGDRDGAATLPA